MSACHELLWAQAPLSPSSLLLTVQVVAFEKEELRRQQHIRSSVLAGRLWPGPSEEAEERRQSSEGSPSHSQSFLDGDFYHQRARAISWVVDLMRPLLEGLGLRIVVSPHGGTAASFAIIEQKNIIVGAHGEAIPCLPVHVKASHYISSRHRVSFSGLKGHPGLVILVQLNNTPAVSQVLQQDCLVAGYLFTGRSIPFKTLTVSEAPGKYAPHKVDEAEDLAIPVVEFARSVFENQKGQGPLKDTCVLMKGGAILSVNHVFPLPTLQKVTTPLSAQYARAWGANDTFFGSKGLLAGPRFQELLTAERKEGSRTGNFMLNCKLKNGVVQLTAIGSRGSLQDGGALCRTFKSASRKNHHGYKPFAAGEFDIQVCYTPCLQAVYLLPDFVLAQRGVRSIEQAPGQVMMQFRPYGGGRKKTTLWNRFLVDCTASEDVVYARCWAILALAAEGKAKGWEAMPLSEELDLAPVTVPLPPGLAERSFSQVEQDPSGSA